MNKKKRLFRTNVGNWLSSYTSGLLKRQCFVSSAQQPVPENHQIKNVENSEPIRALPILFPMMTFLGHFASRLSYFRTFLFSKLPRNKNRNASLFVSSFFSKLRSLVLFVLKNSLNVHSYYQRVASLRMFL